ncbi:hypothetical protein ACU4GA_28440 [Methylobacterium oryzae CBMB20]
MVAGRGAPDATIEMLVDGKPVARVKADANGQFALVPPALPAGASTLRLRMTGTDGRATESQQSVAVNVAPGRDRQPLVALTAPDAATVVLSQPGATADAKGGASGSGAALGTGAADGAPAGRVAGRVVGRAGGSGETREAAASGSGPTRVASVDVQGNGRLFVTATGVPGARIQLYLNDTLIAPGSIGPDGRATFTIGRGIKPGQYQVRIDQVDPATGKVASRAAVPLSVPEPAQVAARETAEPAPLPAQSSARDHGGPDRAARDGAERDRPAASPPAAVSNPQMADMAEPNRVGAVYVPEISTARITRGDNLLADQPAHLRPGRALHGDLRRQPEPDPRSGPDLPRPDLRAAQRQARLSGFEVCRAADPGDPIPPLILRCGRAAAASKEPSSQPRDPWSHPSKPDDAVASG